MSLPYETFLKDTISSYSEFPSYLSGQIVCVNMYKRVPCSSTLLILRGQDLGFPNVIYCPQSHQTKYSENLLLSNFTVNDHSLKDDLVNLCHNNGQLLK